MTRKKGVPLMVAAIIVGVGERGVERAVFGRLTAGVTGANARLVVRADRVFSGINRLALGVVVAARVFADAVAAAEIVCVESGRCRKAIGGDTAGFDARGVGWFGRVRQSVPGD